MSVSEYGRLDLRPDGPIAADLWRYIGAERDAPTLTLTSPLRATNDSPALLTPGMLSWYQRNIAPSRGTALVQVRNALESETLSSGNRGFLLEAELDGIEGRKLAEMRGERDTFHQNPEIVALDREVDRLTTEYERKRAEHGRDAQPWTPVIYIVILVLIGLVLEGPLNWESFLSIDGFTPAFATASYLLVAAAFAVGGHLFGKTVKQWGELFGGEVSRKRRNRARFELGFSLFLFVLGMLLVSYSRYFFLKDAIDRLRALGDDVGSTPYLLTAGAIVGNVIAFGLGGWWSYHKHDPVPEFAEERRTLQRLRERQHSRHGKELEPRLKQRMLLAQKDVTQLKRRDEEQSQALRGYALHRASFEEIRKVDAQVLSLLNEYRARLVDGAREVKNRLQISLDDPLQPGRSTRVDIEAERYPQHPLKLEYR